MRSTLPKGWTSEPNIIRTFRISGVSGYDDTIDLVNGPGEGGATVDMALTTDGGLKIEMRGDGDCRAALTIALTDNLGADEIKKAVADRALERPVILSDLQQKRFPRIDSRHP